MVISITEVRKRLPSMVKFLKASPDTVYQMTVHDEVVAEIKSPCVIKPGKAAFKLLQLRKQFANKRKKYKIEPLSENIKEYLAAEEVFKKFSSDKRFSFCDAISYVVIAHILDGIPCFTFDRDFKSLGVTVYP